MSYQPLPPIPEDLGQLRRRLRRTTDLRLKARLHLLVLIKTQEVQTRQETADYLAVHRNTVGRWLTRYEAEGLEGLLHISQPGAPAGQRTVPESVLEALKQRLKEPEGFGSYLEVQQWLQDEFGLQVPYKSVHKLVRYRLKAKLKRPRPRHDKKMSSSQQPLLSG